MRIGYITSAAVVAVALLATSCAGVAKDHDKNQGTATQQAAPAALSEAAQQARQSFADGAPSVDVLMDEFIQALSRKDMDALTRLRVNKVEYVDLIVPGTVPVGQPPREISEKPREFFWSRLDTRSHYFALQLMDLFGGRAYQSHELRFSRPTKEYAWYKAHGEVRMELHADDGVTYHLLTGWVAEVDGKYKFIGYEYND